MFSLQWATILSALIWSCSSWTIAKADSLCPDARNSSHKIRSVIFELTSKKNQTGHWITEVSVNNRAPKLPDNWRVRFGHKIESCGGQDSFHLQGLLIVPPTLPTDYVLHPGVGYYKLHLTSPGGWDAAYATCVKEGAHLAVINSEPEHQVIRSMVPPNQAYLGFNDRQQEGHFITVFGEPLAATGFAHWAKGQPDNAGRKEHCGSYYPQMSGLNDLPCHLDMPFICEYDLSWAN